MDTKIETSITALCSIIPFVGGPLSVLTSDYFSERKEKRLYEFVESISEGLTQEAHRVIHEYIDGEDFLDILENTLRYVIFERKEEKRKAYQNILVNSMITEGTTYDDTEEFQHFVSILKVQHLQVLKVFNEVQALESDEVRDNRTKMILTLCCSRINAIMKSDVIELIKDLESYNLIDGFIADYGVLDGGAGMIRREGSSITKKGRRLIRYIMHSDLEDF